MDFYETGIYVIIVVVAALVVGLIMRALMTKVKIQNRPIQDQNIADEQEEAMPELLKPQRRPLKPEMEPPEAFIKPETTPPNHSELQANSLMETNHREVAPLATTEKLQTDEQQWQNISLTNKELEIESVEKPNSQSCKEPEAEEDALLDLFKTGEEEDVAMEELANELEDMSGSDLLAEANELSQQLKGEAKVTPSQQEEIGGENS